MLGRDWHRIRISDVEQLQRDGVGVNPLGVPYDQFSDITTPLVAS